MAKGSDGKNNKGFAFVEFKSEDCVKAAVEEWNHQIHTFKESSRRLQVCRDTGWMDAKQIPAHLREDRFEIPEGGTAFKLPQEIQTRVKHILSVHEINNLSQLFFEYGHEYEEVLDYQESGFHKLSHALDTIPGVLVYHNTNTNALACKLDPDYVEPHDGNSVGSASSKVEFHSEEHEMDIENDVHMDVDKQKSGGG